MRLFRAVALVGVGVAMATMPLPVEAQTGPRGQDTYFTFSEPVELPNATLPAGSYLFELVDSTSNRHVVRVMSRDRQKIFTTVMAIPSYSLGRPAEEPQIRFMETPAGSPNVVKIWLYPGRSTGHEFVYPRNRAARLAQATGEPVLTTKSETVVSPSVDDSELTRVDREGRDVDAAMSSQRDAANARSQTGTLEADSPANGAQAPPATPTVPTGATGTAAPATSGAPATGSAGTAATADRAAAAPQVSTPGATVDPGTAATRTRTALPGTASQLPLLSLIGLAALAGSALFRHARRR